MFRRSIKSPMTHLINLLDTIFITFYEIVNGLKHSG